MSENENPVQAPQSSTFETLGYLVNHQFTDDSGKSFGCFSARWRSCSSLGEPRPVETYANELITNIIKDASITASGNLDVNVDNNYDLK